MGCLLFPCCPSRSMLVEVPCLPLKLLEAWSNYWRQMLEKVEGIYRKSVPRRRSHEEFKCKIDWPIAPHCHLNLSCTVNTVSGGRVTEFSAMCFTQARSSVPHLLPGLRPRQGTARLCSRSRERSWQKDSEWFPALSFYPLVVIRRYGDLSGARIGTKGAGFVWHRVATVRKDLPEVVGEAIIFFNITIAEP